MSLFFRFRAVLLCFAILSSIASAAQDNWAFGHLVSPRHDQGVDSLFPGPLDRHLGAAVDAQFFFVNNEYFTPYIEGYTLVGYSLRPTLRWHLCPNLALIGGLDLLQYGGLDRVSRVSPYFAADWQVTPAINLRMGNLLGPASHNLHEAVLECESQLIERPELGLQFSYDANRVFAGHGWVNWRRFIFLGDTVPENFSAGISALLRPRSRFRIPFSIVFEHIGGQISNYPDKMQSLANLSVSPSFDILARLSDSPSFFRSLSLSVHALLFHTMAGASVRPFADGGAFSPELALECRFLRASINWFRAHNFFSPHGNHLYMSLSNYDASVYSPNRSIFTLGASLFKQIGPSARFSLSAKAFYDNFDSRFDYSYAMTLILSPNTIR